MRKSRFPRSLLVFVLATACSTSSSDPGSATDAGGDAGGIDTAVSGDTASGGDTATDDAADVGDAGGCNALVNSAPKITTTKSKATMPAPTGGTIVDGTYFETGETSYEQSTEGPGGDDQETDVIASGKLEVVKVGVTNPTDRTSWTFTTSGTSVVLTRTCPSSKTQTLGYSASGATLSILDPLAKTVKTYTKQ